MLGEYSHHFPQHASFLLTSGQDETKHITMDEVKELKLLDRVIKETLRLYPSVPMYAREISEDCVIGQLNEV